MQAAHRRYHPGCPWEPDAPLARAAPLAPRPGWRMLPFAGQMAGGLAVEALVSPARRAPHAAPSHRMAGRAWRLVAQNRAHPNRQKLRAGGSRLLGWLALPGDWRMALAPGRAGPTHQRRRRSPRRSQHPRALPVPTASVAMRGCADPELLPTAGAERTDSVGLALPRKAAPAWGLTARRLANSPPRPSLAAPRPGLADQDSAARPTPPRFVAGRSYHPSQRWPPTAQTSLLVAAVPPDSSDLPGCSPRMAVPAPNHPACAPLDCQHLPPSVDRRACLRLDLLADPFHAPSRVMADRPIDPERAPVRAPGPTGLAPPGPTDYYPSPSRTKALVAPTDDYP